MVQLKLALWEGALNETALSIAKLSRLVVTPEEECSEVESCEAMTLTARDVGDMKRLLVLIKSIVHL